MENEEIKDDKAKAASEPSADENHGQSHSDGEAPKDGGSGSDKAGGNDGGKQKGEGDDEIRIPKHRFDEEVKKRKDLERRLDEREKLDERLKEAIGGKKRPEEADDEFAEISRKYSVDRGFLSEVASAVERRAEQRLDARLAPVKKVQEETMFEREERQLAKDFPEYEDLSSEDRKKIRDAAFSKQYSAVPLADIYKMQTYDRPRGQRKTAEDYRGGGARKDAGQEPDWRNMPPEEFKKWSDGLQTKRGR